MDIAEESVRRDARERYNTQAFPMSVRFFVADAFAVRLERPFPEGISELGPFDCVRRASAQPREMPLPPAQSRLAHHPYSVIGPPFARESAKNLQRILQRICRNLCSCTSSSRSYQPPLISPASI